MSASCPDDAALQNLIAGTGASDLEAHLDECQRCAARLEELAGASTFEDQFAKAAAPGAHESVELTQLIDHLKASPVELTHSDDSNPIAERFPAGAKLDGYRIEGLIARGGMGVVLKAYDAELERAVAIKLLDPARFSGADAAERFLREARAAAAIDHENVLPIFTTGTSEGLPYLVMPFVEGETLQDRVEREGALAPDEAARIARAVASGLAAAHSAGLVHRDVKPANILLEPDGGRVWIADFGLARAAEEPSITREGVMAGTPQFMSPEQAEGGEADERSDLFSLGAVMYFMLAGRPPFGGASAITVLRQVADSDPEWSGLSAGKCPAILQSVVRRLMEKSPRLRPKSAAEVVGLLESRRERAKAAFVWLAVMACCLLGVSIWIASQHLRKVEASVVATAQGQQFSSLRGALAGVPDGAVIELVRDIVIDGASLPPLDRPLTLRAAEGVDVEIQRSDLRGPVLDIRSAVTIEGVKITQPLMVPEAGEFLPALVSVGEGGAGTLTNCSLFRARPGKPHGRTDGADGGPPACIEVADGGVVTLVRTELMSAVSIGIGLREGSRAVISESVLGCEYGIFCEGRTSVRLERCAFLGLATFMTSGVGGVASIEIESNALLSLGAVIWTKTDVESAAVDMKSGGNLYCPQLGYAITGLPDRVRPLPSNVTIGSARGWREFAHEPEGVSIELPRLRVMQMIRNNTIADVHAAPELALERIRTVFRILRTDYPEMGCDVNLAGAGNF